MSKVALVACSNYDSEEVYQAICKGIDLIGGLEKFLKPEEKILIKPNLLNRADISKAVTTHPIVFEGVVKCLLGEGFKNLTYGDSPAHPGSARKTAEICGIAEKANAYNVPMADFSKSDVVTYRSGRVKRQYEFCQGVLDADAIVNVCKMKTHALERITGAVKNMFGCVYGLNKSKMHAKYPDPNSFAQMLVEVNMFLKPRLHIMDGIVAMEGNGPGNGDPIPMKVLLFSEDPVALDTVFCQLINLNPNSVPTIYFGDKLGLGTKKDIEIVTNEDFDQIINKSFKVERTDKLRSGWRYLKALKYISKRPVVIDSKCIRCGACVTACPVEGKAISLDENFPLNPPTFDYKKCIRCYCCQEICPVGAIVVKWGIGN